MATTNLALTELTGSQNQKYITINEALEDLDNATQGSLAIAVVGETTLTAAQYTATFAFVLSGTPGAFVLNVPATKRLFAVVNNTDGAATVQVDGTAGVSIDVGAGDAGLCYCDGTDVYSVGGGGGGGSALAISDETISVLAAATGIDFSGTGVTVTDDGDDTVTVTIPGLSDSPTRTGVFRGARSRRGTDLSVLTGAFRVLTFPTEEYDTSGFHDNSTNSERLTVPAGFGITKVSLKASFRFDDLASDTNGWPVVRLMKNGAEVTRGWGDVKFSGDTRVVIDVDWGTVPVAENDYFHFEVFTGEDATLDATSWMEMLVVEDQSNAGTAFAQNWSVPFRGALAYLTANNTAQDISTFGDYSWDTVQYDTDDFWDAAQPSRFTIPAGVTKVRLAGSIQVTGDLVAEAATYMVIQKNGSANYRGGGRSAANTGFTNQISTINTGVIEVVEGDYFTFDIGIAGETNEEVLASASYFQIEVVETDSGQNRLFDVSTFVPGTPTAGAIVLQHVLARAATLKAGAPGAQAYADTAATGSTVFDITKNGANVGTITWDAAGQVGAFSVASDVTFTAGDRVAIVAESPADGTLADVSITLPIAIG